MNFNNMNIEEIKNIEIEDFDYPLPDSRIALHPLAQRDSCKLIVASPEGRISHHHFFELPGLLPDGALMIANETKVINARMEFFKESGARIEIFLLEPSEPSDYAISFASRGQCVWSCMVGNLKKWKGAPLSKPVMVKGVSDEVRVIAELLPEESGAERSSSRRVLFRWDNPRVSFAEIVEGAGNIPIPPYLNRKSEESDLSDYQTVYSRVEGSVAAPTAGLHFTPELFAKLNKRDVQVEKVTLHVGAGTFQPVKSPHIGEHPMHTETIHVELSLIEALINAIGSGRPVIAVGTTSVRTIESLPYFGYLILKGGSPLSPEEMHVRQWLAYEKDLEGYTTLELLRALADGLRREGLDALSGSTAIMIAPGFKWRIVDIMITNFHQPKSTLLLLVSSFLENGGGAPSRWREIYDEALREDYRFLSYGDACLFINC